MEPEGDSKAKYGKLNCIKKARKLTRFSPKQVTELEKKFHENEYLSENEIGELSERTKMQRNQVKTWFQNRRSRKRRKCTMMNRPRTDCIKKARKFIRFSPKQVTELEKKFHENEHLSENEICELSERTKMQRNQVKTWFQNRRARERRICNMMNRTGRKLRHYSPPVSSHDISPNIDLSSYSCSLSSPTISPLSSSRSPISYQCFSPTNLYDESFSPLVSGHPTAQSETDACAYSHNITASTFV